MARQDAMEDVGQNVENLFKYFDIKNENLNDNIILQLKSGLKTMIKNKLNIWFITFINNKD